MQVTKNPLTCDKSGSTEGEIVMHFSKKWRKAQFWSTHDKETNIFTDVWLPTLSKDKWHALQCRVSVGLHFC